MATRVCVCVLCVAAIYEHMYVSTSPLIVLVCVESLLRERNRVFIHTSTAAGVSLSVSGCVCTQVKPAELRLLSSRNEKKGARNF